MRPWCRATRSYSCGRPRSSLPAPWLPHWTYDAATSQRWHPRTRERRLCLELRSSLGPTYAESGYLVRKSSCRVPAMWLDEWWERWVVECQTIRTALIDSRPTLRRSATCISYCPVASRSWQACWWSLRPASSHGQCSWACPYRENTMQVIGASSGRALMPSSLPSSGMRAGQRGSDVRSWLPRRSLPGPCSFATRGSTSSRRLAMVTNGSHCSPDSAPRSRWRCSS